MLEVKNITCIVDENHVLDDINFTVESGKICCVSGISGIGKSLLFSLMCGINKPDSGDIKVKNVSLFNSPSEHIIDLKRKFGVVFQEPAIISNLTIYENLMLTQNVCFPEESEAQKDSNIRNELKLFNLVSHINQRPDSLSKGQRYQLAMARAFINNPSVFLWDEPFINIDEFYHQLLDERIMELKKNNCLILFFTNRDYIIKRYSDMNFELGARGR